jgi:hypothetical protein
MALSISPNRHTACGSISSFVYNNQEDDASEIVQLGGARSLARKLRQGSALPPCPALALAGGLLLSSLPPPLLLLSNYTVVTKANISSTINNIFSNTQQLQQQQQQLQHHGLLWTVLRRISDLIRNLFNKEPAEVPKRYSYAEAGWFEPSQEWWAHSLHALHVDSTGPRAHPSGDHPGPGGMVSRGL